MQTIHQGTPNPNPNPNPPTKKRGRPSSANNLRVVLEDPNNATPKPNKRPPTLLSTFSTPSPFSPPPSVSVTPNPKKDASQAQARSSSTTKPLSSSNKAKTGEYHSTPSSPRTPSGIVFGDNNGQHLRNSNTMEVNSAASELSNLKAASPTPAQTTVFSGTFPSYMRTNTTLSTPLNVQGLGATTSHHHTTTTTVSTSPSPLVTALTTQQRGISMPFNNNSNNFLSLIPNNMNSSLGYSNNNNNNNINNDVTTLVAVITQQFSNQFNQHLSEQREYQEKKELAHIKVLETIRESFHNSTNTLQKEIVRSSEVVLQRAEKMFLPLQQQVSQFDGRLNLLETTLINKNRLNEVNFRNDLELAQLLNFIIIQNGKLKDYCGNRLVYGPYKKSNFPSVKESQWPSFGQGQTEFYILPVALIHQRLQSTLKRKQERTGWSLKKIKTKLIGLIHTDEKEITRTAIPLNKQNSHPKHNILIGKRSWDNAVEIVTESQNDETTKTLEIQEEEYTTSNKSKRRSSTSLKKDKDPRNLPGKFFCLANTVWHHPNCAYLWDENNEFYKQLKMVDSDGGIFYINGSNGNLIVSEEQYKEFIGNREDDPLLFGEWTEIDDKRNKTQQKNKYPEDKKSSKSKVSSSRKGKNKKKKSDEKKEEEVEKEEEEEEEGEETEVEVMTVEKETPPKNKTHKKQTKRKRDDNNKENEENNDREERETSFTMDKENEESRKPPKKRKTRANGPATPLESHGFQDKETKSLKKDKAPPKKRKKLELSVSSPIPVIELPDDDDDDDVDSEDPCSDNLNQSPSSTPEPSPETLSTQC